MSFCKEGYDCLFSIKVDYDFETSSWVRSDMSSIDDMNWSQDYNLYPRKNDALKIDVGT